MRSRVPTLDRSRGVPRSSRLGPHLEDSVWLPLTGKSALAYHRHLDVFKALADPTRRAILDELTDRDGQTLFELCSRLLMKHGIDSTRQAISQHLDALEGAGLVTIKRDGRYKFHYLDGTPLKEITDRWPIRDRRSP